MRKRRLKLKLKRMMNIVIMMEKEEKTEGKRRGKEVGENRKK